MARHQVSGNSTETLDGHAQPVRSDNNGINPVVNAGVPGPAAPAAIHLASPDFAGYKSVCRTTILLLVELAIIEAVYIIIWTTKTTISQHTLSPGRITSNLDHSHDLCNVSDLNDHSMESQFIYHVLNAVYVAFRLIYLFQAQLCQWKPNRDQTSCEQKRCNWAISLLGLVNIILPLVLMFTMVDRANPTIKDVTDHGFGESIKKTVGSYHIMGLFWMWIFDVLIFVVAWIGGHGGGHGAICDPDFGTINANDEQSHWGSAIAWCALLVFFFFIALLAVSSNRGVAHSLNNGVRFVSLDVRLSNQTINITSNYTAEYNYDIAINGDEYLDDDSYQSYIYKKCMPFYVDSTNKAGLNYKGARFDNIIAVSDDEYQIYVYCHRNLIRSEIGCEIHKLARDDVIIARYWIDFLDCRSFDNITAAVVMSSENKTTLHNVVFGVCYDAFIVNMNN